MDLRERPSVNQRIAEAAMRFRLIEIVALLAMFAVALINAESALTALISLSDAVGDFILHLTVGDFSNVKATPSIPFAVAVIFLFRWKFFGFKCGLLWFFFLLFSALFLLAIGACSEFSQIFIAAVLILSVTAFFFVRSLLIKSIFPLLFLGWTLLSWLLFLGVSKVLLFGLITLLFADACHLIFGIAFHISGDARRKKTLSGAIAHGIKKTLPVSLLTVTLLVILDLIFGADFNMQGTFNVGIYIGYVSYVLWMPFFTAAVLSFCPLENTCEKIRKK